jgi:hypothetical protein
MKSRCITLLLVVTVLTGPLHAQIYVNNNLPAGAFADGSAEHPFHDIQTAIDAAVDGDTVIVAPGRYLSGDPWAYAELLFRGKSIRLTSSAPTDWTVIERTILSGVVIFDGTEGPETLLQGFKIQNHGHGGILGNGTQATVSHCVISGNGPCGATVVKDIHGQLRNCLIVDNASFENCGVLPVVSGCHTIINCTIANNLSGVALTNAGLPTGGQVTIRNSIIYGNQDPAVIVQLDSTLPTGGVYFEYCLVDAPSISGRISPTTILRSDPLFVRLGRWEDAPAPTTGGTVRRDVLTVASVRKRLVEGDYRLRTEGWRWSPQPVHGSHWYYDELTSPAIDAGDPIDGLGEELERAPDDPEGLWGINRAIDLGTYGGTAQASLAPTDGDAPGIGAVDLRDYWPLIGVSHTPSRWHVHNPQGNARQIYVSGGSSFGNITYVSYLRTNNDPDWVARVNCYYVNRTLYMTEDSAGALPPTQPPARVQARYPQFLVPGTTIEAPYDPLVKGTAEYRSVIVLRGTLEDMLAETDLDTGQFVMGPWPDVIALQENTSGGAPGQLIAMFARGFGPLMLAGQPVEYAEVHGRSFTTSARATWPSGGTSGGTVRR